MKKTRSKRAEPKLTEFRRVVEPLASCGSAPAGGIAFLDDREPFLEGDADSIQLRAVDASDGGHRTQRVFLSLGVPGGGIVVALDTRTALLVAAEIVELGAELLRLEASGPAESAGGGAGDGR